ncbi:hypothetical protein, partial [Sphingomonas hylomeconis]
IALNEWPLLGARIASLNVRVWAKTERQLHRRKDPIVDAQGMDSLSRSGRPFMYDGIYEPTNSRR